MSDFPTPNMLHEAELGFDDSCFQPTILNYSTSLLSFLTLMGLIETRLILKLEAIFFSHRKAEYFLCPEKIT